MRASGQKLPAVVSVVLLVLCCSALLTSADNSTGKKRIWRPVSVQSLLDNYEDTQRSEDGTGRNLFRKWLRHKNFFLRKKNNVFTTTPTTPTTTTTTSNIVTPSGVVTPNARNAAANAKTNIDDKLADYVELDDLYDGHRHPYNTKRVDLREVTTDNHSDPPKLRKTSGNRINQQKILNNNSNNRLIQSITTNRPLNRLQSVFNAFRRQTPVIYN